MRRVPLKRGQPMKRARKPIARTARLRARRVSKRFAAKRDPVYCAWIRTLACVVRGCASLRSECCHVRSRGAGGADRGNTIPMCRRHHAEQHQLGIKTFQHVYIIDLACTAERLAQRADAALPSLAARYAERYAAEGAT